MQARRKVGRWRRMTAAQKLDALMRHGWNPRPRVPYRIMMAIPFCDPITAEPRGYKVEVLDTAHTLRWALLRLDYWGAALGVRETEPYLVDWRGKEIRPLNN